MSDFQSLLQPLLAAAILPPASSSSKEEIKAAQTVAREDTLSLITSHLASPTPLGPAHIQLRAALKATTASITTLPSHSLLTSNTLSTLPPPERDAVYAELRTTWVNLFNTVYTILTNPLLSLFPKPSSQNPESPIDRVDREGTPRDETYAAYEGVLVEITPKLTQFCGSRSGVVKLDKHAGGVKKVLMKLLNLKLVRKELIELWMKQLCMQEGWDYADHDVNPPPSQSPTASPASPNSTWNDPPPPTAMTSPSPATHVGPIPLPPPPPAATAPPGGGEDAGVAMSRHNLFNLPPPDPKSSWPLRFSGVNILKTLAGYRPSLDKVVHKVSCYYLHVLLSHGKWDASHQIAMCMASYVLAAKSLDAGFRLSALVTDQKLQAQLRDCIPATAVVPTVAELAEEFEAGKNVTWSDGKLYRNEAGGKQLETKCVALPSLIEAYEFQLLNLLGFDIQVMDLIPDLLVGYLRNPKSGDKLPVLPDSVYTHIKGLFADDMFLASGLVILNNPKACLLGAVLMSCKRCKVDFSDSFCLRYGINKKIVEKFAKHMFNCLNFKKGEKSEKHVDEAELQEVFAKCEEYIVRLADYERELMKKSNGGKSKPIASATAPLPSAQLPKETTAAPPIAVVKAKGKKRKAPPPPPPNPPPPPTDATKETLPPDVLKQLEQRRASQAIEMEEKEQKRQRRKSEGGGDDNNQ